MTLRKAARSDLQRITELNNHQPVQPGRQSDEFREISHWHHHPAYTLLVAEAADKFGPMGLISAAVLKSDPSALSILIFVLRCRVFGYGIETVMLNTAKRLAFEVMADHDPSQAPSPKLPTPALQVDVPR